MPEFEWDEGNLDHVTPRYSQDEVESVFSDSGKVSRPAYTKDGEVRYAVIGRSNQERFITVVYTYRGDRLRVVTARPSRRDERERYRRSQS